MGKQLIENAKRGTIFYVDPWRLMVIGVDTDDGPEHRLWDERTKLPTDESMVLSIAELGVKQTVLVEMDGDRILVVDGRRRVLHAREANARLEKAGDQPILVPVLAEKGDEKAAELAMIALNEIRTDDPTMTKAAKAARMIARGHGKDSVAKAFGVTVSTVEFWGKLISLGSDARKAIDAGQITPTAASKLAALPKSEQAEHVKRMVAEHAATGKKTPVTRAKATADAAKAGREEVTLAPSKKLLKRIVDEGADLDPEFVRGIRFALGDLDAKAIKGLTAIINGTTTTTAE